MARTTPRKKKAAAFSPTLLGAFNESLQKLAASPRYPLVRGLQLGALLPEGSATASRLEGMSISDLSSKGIQGVAKLEQIDAQDLRMLVELFERLAVPGAEEPAPAFQDTVAPSPHDAALHAIERSGVEIALAEKKRELKRISKDLLSSKVLSDYWREGWARAPFEEAMTFKQFSDLDFETLVRKKTFDVQKMKAVMNAIEDFLSEHELRPRSRKSSQSLVVDRELAALAAETPVLCAPSLYPLALITQNLVRYFEHQCSLYTNAQGPMRVLFGHLPITFRAHEAALISLSVNEAPGLARKLVGMKEEDFEREMPAVLGKLRQLFESACPKLAANWIASLSAPGISEESLFGPCFDDAFDEEFQRMIFRALLKALGADHPVIDGVVFPDLWTLSQATAALLVQAICAQSADVDTRMAMLSGVLPCFPESSLRKLAMHAAR